jgi:hypothetical protein
VNTDGRMGIGHTLDGINRNLEEIPFDVDLRTDDVVMKIDLIGDEISVSAWRAGDEPVDLPPLAFRDDRLTVGTVGATVFPRDLGSAAYRWMEVAEIVPGDVDTNSVIDIRDLDYLTLAVQQANDGNRYDVNRDGEVNADDRRDWIDRIHPLWLGDSNVDGEFNSADLVTVLQAGEYEDELTANSRWETGDWNGDLEFDSGDFVAALEQGGYGQGARPPLAMAVPEPATATATLLAILAAVVQARRLHRGDRRGGRDE